VFNLSRLLRAVERRDRRLHGLHLAGLVLAVAGAMALAVVAACRVGLLSLSWPALGGVVALPLACALFAFLGVRRPKVSLPRLLLRIDQTLGTSERLSSLLELRQRGGRDVFRRRIEQHFQDGPLLWKKGLPVGFSHVGPLAVGILLVVGSLLLVVFAPFPPAGIAEPLPTEARTAGGDRAATVALEPTGPAFPQEAQISSTTNLEHADTPAPERFEDVLSDIWGAPATGGSVLTDGGALGELIEEQQQRAQALEEILSRIEEQLRQGQQAGLTEDERRALSQMLPSVTDPQLRQTLENLVEETDPEALQEQVEQALGLTRAIARSQTDQSAQQQEKIRPTPEDLKESESAFDWTPPEAPEEETSAEGAQTARSATGEDRDDGASEQGQPGHGEEDIDSRGGTSGAPGEMLPSEQRPSFVPTDLAARVGSTGGFDEFLTKGVPLELDVAQGEEDLYSVNYETLRAILEGRLILPEARDVVKRYFDTITQGGP
jgi:hypothetical protein